MLPLPTAQVFSNYLKDDKAPSISSDANSLSYTTWIRDWTTHLSGISDNVLVPRGHSHYHSTGPHTVAKQSIKTSQHPLLYLWDISRLQTCLQENPSTLLKLAYKNMISANEHPEVVDEYLAAEIAQSCVASKFEKLATPRGHISRFGVIPKKHSKKWRLIVDLVIVLMMESQKISAA